MSYPILAFSYGHKSVSITLFKFKGTVGFLLSRYFDLRNLFVLYVPSDFLLRYINLRIWLLV
jgi:hypothetical protein